MNQGTEQPEAEDFSDRDISEIGEKFDRSKERLDKVQSMSIPSRIAANGSKLTELWGRYRALANKLKDNIPADQDPKNEWVKAGYKVVEAKKKLLGRYDYLLEDLKVENDDEKEMAILDKQEAALHELEGVFAYYEVMAGIRKEPEKERPPVEPKPRTEPEELPDPPKKEPKKEPKPEKPAEPPKEAVKKATKTKSASKLPPKKEKTDKPERKRISIPVRPDKELAEEMKKYCSDISESEKLDEKYKETPSDEEIRAYLQQLSDELAKRKNNSITDLPYLDLKFALHISLLKNCLRLWNRYEVHDVRVASQMLRALDQMNDLNNTKEKELRDEIANFIVFSSEKRLDRQILKEFKSRISTHRVNAAKLNNSLDELIKSVEDGEKIDIPSLFWDKVGDPGAQHPLKTHLEESVMYWLETAEEVGGALSDEEKNSVDEIKKLYNFAQEKYQKLKSLVEEESEDKPEIKPKPVDEADASDEEILRFINENRAIDNLTRDEAPTVKDGVLTVKNRIMRLRDIKNLPEGIKQINGNVEIGKGVVSLPKSLHTVTGVLSFDMFGSKVTSLGGLKKVEALNLAGCHELKVLPEGLTADKIHGISYRYSGVRSLPDGLTVNGDLNLGDMSFIMGVGKINIKGNLLLFDDGRNGNVPRGVLKNIVESKAEIDGNIVISNATDEYVEKYKEEYPTLASKIQNEEEGRK